MDRWKVLNNFGNKWVLLFAFFGQKINMLKNGWLRLWVQNDERFFTWRLGHGEFVKRGDPDAGQDQSSNKFNILDLAYYFGFDLVSNKEFMQGFMGSTLVCREDDGRFV